MLKKGKYASQIAKACNVNKSTVSSWLKKLESMGFIERESRSSYISYKVKQTVFGQSCESSVTDRKPLLSQKIMQNLGVFRWEKESFYYLILEFPKIVLPAPSQMKQFKQSFLKFREGTVRIGFDCKKPFAIIHPKFERAFSVEEASTNYKNKASKLKERLERLGFVLGEPRVSNKPEFAEETSKFAKLPVFEKAELSFPFDGLEGLIDDSPKEGKEGREFEFRGNRDRLLDYARKQAEMPIKVDELCSEVSSMKALLQGSVNVSQRIDGLISVLANQQRQINNLLELLGGGKREGKDNRAGG